MKTIIKAKKPIEVRRYRMSGMVVWLVEFLRERAEMTAEMGERTDQDALNEHDDLKRHV
jgi:hypothetical protein